MLWYSILNLIRGGGIIFIFFQTKIQFLIMENGIDLLTVIGMYKTEIILQGTNMVNLLLAHIWCSKCSRGKTSAWKITKIIL